MDSAQKEAVESAIEIACSKVFEILDEKLETISNIGDENAIKTAVVQGVLSASQAYPHDATRSWNKAAGKAVISNVISNGIWILQRFLEPWICLTNLLMGIVSDIRLEPT